MEKETKEDRFKRVGTKRVKRILNDLRLLGNCSNKSMYSWNEDQLKKIWSAIDKELRVCKASFENRKHNNFKL